MFIDAHYHPETWELICPDEETAKMRRKSMNMPKTSIKTMEGILIQMDVIGLDKVCIFAKDYHSADGFVCVSNEDIAKIVNAYPDKFIGIASVDPNDPDHLEKAEHAFRDLGLKGLKLHPGRQAFFPSDPKLEPLYQLCEKYDKPIVFHAGLSLEKNCETKYSNPLEFEPVALKHPNLRMCLCHMGWPWVRETAMLMLKYRNVYADTSVLYMDSAGEFLKQVLTVDIPWTWVDRSLRHQIMFGSNGPRFEQRRLAIAFDQLPLRDETKELIKSTNAIEFFKL